LGLNHVLRIGVLCLKHADALLSLPLFFESDYNLVLVFDVVKNLNELKSEVKDKHG
jgi:hypothetical protein